MASLHVAFCKIGATAFGHLVPVADSESVVSSTLTTSASNAQSAAGTMPFVRIATDSSAHYVAFGSNPDATTTTGRYYIPAYSVEYFQVEVGNKVAAVTA